MCAYKWIECIELQKAYKKYQLSSDTYDKHSILGIY